MRGTVHPTVSPPPKPAKKRACKQLPARSLDTCRKTDTTGNSGLSYRTTGTARERVRLPGRSARVWLPSCISVPCHGGAGMNSAARRYTLTSSSPGPLSVSLTRDDDTAGTLASQTVPALRVTREIGGAFKPHSDSLERWIIRRR